MTLKKTPDEVLYLNDYHFYRTEKNCVVVDKISQKVVISFTSCLTHLTYSVVEGNKLAVKYDNQKLVFDCDKLAVVEKTGSKKLLSKLCFKVSKHENIETQISNSYTTHSPEVYYLEDFIVTGGNRTYGIFNNGEKVDSLVVKEETIVSIGDGNELLVEKKGVIDVYNALLQRITQDTGLIFSAAENDRNNRML